MAGFSEKIRILFDIDEKGATGPLGKIKTSVHDADGAFGKLKAGSISAFDSMKENAAGFALAAGAALVTFSLKAIGAFQDTALEAGKFAEATGLAVDDASRWIEVAGDMGIEAGTLEGAFRKFNLAAADGKPSIQEYGVEIVKTSEGVIDANASFQNAITTIGAIKDPTDRAKAAQELFGKSYGEVAEIMEMSAGELEAALDGVADSKVIDQEELDKARDYRDALDNLKDIFEDVKMQVGEALVPKLTELADALIAVNDAADAIPGGKGGLGGLLETSYNSSGLGKLAGDVNLLNEAIQGVPLENLADEVAIAALATEDLDEAAEDAGDDGLRTFSDAAHEAERAADDAERAARDLKDTYAELTGNLSDRQAWLNLQTDLDEFAMKMGAGTLSSREAEQAVIDIRLKLLEYLGTLEDVPAQKQTEILSLIDQGRYDEVKAMLDQLAAPRTVSYTPTGDSRDRDGRRAHGGPVSAGGTYLVGEQGPEVVTFGANGFVTPNDKLGGVGGSTVNITINAPTGNAADIERATVEALKRYTQRGGRI